MAEAVNAWRGGLRASTRSTAMYSDSHFGLQEGLAPETMPEPLRHFMASSSSKKRMLSEISAATFGSDSGSVVLNLVYGPASSTVDSFVSGSASTHLERRIKADI